MFSLNSTIILPKGYSVGMGKLTQDTPATIVGVDRDDNDRPFYIVSFTGKNHKLRYVTISEEQLQGSSL